MTILQAQWATFGFIVFSFALIVGFDALWITLYGPEASISRVVSHAFGKYPSLLVAFING